MQLKIPAEADLKPGRIIKARNTFEESMLLVG